MIPLTRGELRPMLRVSEIVFLIPVQNVDEGEQAGALPHSVSQGPSVW